MTVSFRQSHLPRPTSLTNGAHKTTSLNPHGPSPNTHNQHGPSDHRRDQRGPSANGHDQHRPSDHRHAVDARGQRPRQKLPENGFMSPEADSGFMGSESSRQSNQNGGTGYDGRNQLRKPRERFVQYS